MRKGKMVAQGAHASLGAWLLLHGLVEAYDQGQYDPKDDLYSADVLDAASAWINGTFTKVCVSVNSEDELMKIYADATWAGLPAVLVTDVGHTEFHGVPTKTCLAIGPAWADDIDKITGGLPLL